MSQSISAHQRRRRRAIACSVLALRVPPLEACSRTLQSRAPASD
ncbi:hypothetical protein Ctob_007011 [Chrysochromulina tobinii]|uniref:Uncharacterized protein n=1 Tax=Chrysochromulina tobinii TaxID=1460289 RepID=A0A0M0JDC8_9EUKA|nr:hypothetical protein Ctob_007011 [Chrysochromulina tobinii]|eukprot:KOO24589.1 hypothetical protein Ctob_007011 [Chrysochromulina sp. CCMP291]